MEFDGLDLANEPTLQLEESTNLCMPQVGDERKPKIGQEFATLEEVHTFYNNYAKEGGFSVRIQSSRRSKCKGRENELLMKQYVCSKEGKKGLQIDRDVRRRRGNTREGCKARLRVMKSKSGTHFVVSIFDEGHNHPLATPNKVGFLRSHRQVNEQSRMRKLLDGHDADLLHEHFLTEQENNPSFRYVIEADDGGKLIRVFWTDATMRMAYSYYGDVIVFDTTYNTNRYGMIFAPIFGVSNHWKTVTFSCAFLSDETAESFEWLFSQFLRFMPGPSPRMIITNQDLAIEKAIGSNLGETKHKFCIWHILNKFSEKLDPCTYDVHYPSFKSCIWDSESREEFDDNWLKLLEIANLKDHGWLNSLYKVREKWAPAYVRHIFSAGMLSSQRAESHHAFFKRYGDKRDSLTDFIIRFNRGLARQRHEELNEDHANIIEQPSIRTPLFIEKQLADIYTRFIFFKVQEELWQSMQYRVTVKSNDETTCLYKVVRGGGIPSREREVVENKDSDFISCSCKKFECEGIPCRHMMALFKKNDIENLHTKYILRRWTKGAKMGQVVDDVRFEVSDTADKGLLTRRTILSQLSSQIIDDVLGNEDDFLMFKDTLMQFCTNLKQSNPVCVVGDSTTINRPSQSIYSEPSHASFTGCGKRLKSEKEKFKSKPRRCNYCGELGATHDKRNCPKKIIGVAPLCISGSPSECSFPEDKEEIS